MHQTACIYMTASRQMWNNTYLEYMYIYKPEGGNIAKFCFQDKQLSTTKKTEFLSFLHNDSLNYI